MKTSGIYAAAFLALVSLPVNSQQADAKTEQTATARASVSPVDETGRGTAAVLASPAKQMRPVSATLMGSLDSKSAKLGAEVELRTQIPIVTASGVSIPKGSRIMGRVISVEAHKKGGADAAVALQFDRAELKGGQSLAIRSEIRWVAPPPNAATSSFMQSQENIGGGVMGNATQVMGGARNGGLGTGTSGSLTVSGGRVQVTPMDSQGLNSVADYGVKEQAADPSQEQAGAERSRLVAAAAAERAAAHATGVSGVMLAGDVSGKLSGTFSATGQNVHLDGGTQVVLEIGAIN